MSRPLSAGVLASALPLAWRLGLATTALLMAAYFYSHQIVSWLLPMLSRALEFVADDFKIVRLDFMQERGNTSIGALALLQHTLVLGEQVVVPDGKSVMLVGTTVGTVLQPLWVALALVLAWPARWVEMAARLAIASVLLGVVLLVDTPLSLAAWLWDVELRAHAPDRISLLVWWNTFLNGGGRLALGLAAAASSVVLAQRMPHRSSASTTAAATPIEESQHAH